MTEPSEVRRPSPEMMEAVRASCAVVARRPEELAEAFYSHLFAMAPGVRSLFPADMSAQMRRMTETLLAAITALDRPDTLDLELTLRALGADHRQRYGVLPEHYRYIGHALTRAVRDVAGPLYSGYLSSSWIALYRWVELHMTAGARSAEQPVFDEAPFAPMVLPRPRPADHTHHVRP